VKGQARFVGERTVDIGGTCYEADAIVVATGARPRPLAIEGESHVVTSDTVLNLDALPKSIAFLGAGVIAFEFAHVFARAGAKVTLLEIGERALSTHDPSCVERLVRATRALGVEILTGVKLRGVGADGDGYVVRYEHEGRTNHLGAALVANGAGRVPDYAGLALDAAGIALHDGKPRLDPQLRSLENPRVWFAGDVRPGPQLSPLATYEGRLVGRAILGGTERPAYTSIPSVVYTIPPLASVGKMEEEARATGRAIDVIESDMRGWKSARTYGEDEAYAKVLVDKDSGRIVGAHILRRHAEEAIHALASAMKNGMTAKDVREEVFAFPTVTADVKYLVG
jgi:glutathione reductase (NADPH)